MTSVKLQILVPALLITLLCLEAHGQTPFLAVGGMQTSDSQRAHIELISAPYRRPHQDTPIRIIARQGSILTPKRMTKRRSRFVGRWKTRLTQKQNSCSASIPTAFEMTLSINSRHFATDIGDGSPFFTGLILAKDQIGFGREAFRDGGCIERQTYLLKNVRGNRSVGVLRSYTTCGPVTCSYLYSGNSRRR